MPTSPNDSSPPMTPAKISSSGRLRSHLAALLPRQLIYASFLPDDAQAAMAQTGTAQQAVREATARPELGIGAVPPVAPRPA